MTIMAETNSDRNLMLIYKSLIGHCFTQEGIDNHQLIAKTLNDAIDEAVSVFKGDKSHVKISNEYYKLVSRLSSSDLSILDGKTEIERFRIVYYLI